MRGYSSLNPFLPFLEIIRRFRKNQTAELLEQIDQQGVYFQVPGLIGFRVEEQPFTFCCRTNKLVDQGCFPNPSLSTDQDQFPGPDSTVL